MRRRCVGRKTFADGYKFSVFLRCNKNKVLSFVVEEYYNRDRGGGRDSFGHEGLGK